MIIDELKREKYNTDSSNWFGFISRLEGKIVDDESISILEASLRISPWSLTKNYTS